MDKKLYIPVFILLLASCFYSISAQDDNEYKTIIKDGEIGGFASFGAAYSLVDNRNSIVLHSRGGIVVRHCFSIGFAGATFMNDYQQISPGSNLESSLVGGYGGVYSEVFILQRAPIHISIPVIAGLGGVSYSEWDRASSDGFTQTGTIKDETTFFIVEPGAEINFRLARWLKAAFYSTYRFTTPLSERFANEYNVNRDGIEGYSFGINLKVGKF